MAIESNLPEGLWPELVATAAYLLNRAPTRSLDWKTPFEVATGRKPLVAHLYKVGSRAYASYAYKTNPSDRPRKNKLDSRCHIGYLIGFESHNIYRIWIPSQKRVIRTRDVIFNEEIKYEGHRDKDLGSVLQDDIRLAISEEQQIQSIPEQFANLMSDEMVNRLQQQESMRFEHLNLGENAPDNDVQVEPAVQPEGVAAGNNDDVEYEIPYDHEAPMQGMEHNTEFQHDTEFQTVQQQDLQNTALQAMELLNNVPNTPFEHVSYMLPEHERPPSVDLEPELQRHQKSLRLNFNAVTAMAALQEEAESGLSRRPILLTDLPPEPKKWKDL